MTNTEKIIKMPKRSNKNQLEGKTRDELLDLFGSVTFAVALQLQKTEKECLGCIGMNMLPVFYDALEQAHYASAKDKKEEQN